MRLRKPNHCPSCQSPADIRYIVRGLPSELERQMIRDGEAVPGGCIMFAHLPHWHCGVCNHEFSDDTDPEVIRRRRFEQRLLGYDMSCLLSGEAWQTDGLEALPLRPTTDLSAVD